MICAFLFANDNGTFVSAHELIHRLFYLFFLEENCSSSFEPRCEKTGLQGFRQGLAQTRLYSHRGWLEA